MSIYRNIRIAFLSRKVRFAWNVKCFWKYTILRKPRPRNAGIFYLSEIHVVNEKGEL